MLQDVLRKTIESVLDMDAFEHEQEQEGHDAAKLQAIRETVLHQLEDLELGE